MYIIIHPSIKNESRLAKEMTDEYVCLNLRILTTSSYTLTQISHKSSYTLCPFVQLYLVRSRLHHYNIILLYHIQ